MLVIVHAHDAICAQHEVCLLYGWPLYFNYQVS